MRKGWMIAAGAMALVTGVLWSARNPERAVAEPRSQVAIPQEISQNKATAVFAGGCFWCMESEFDSEPGVLGTTVGYTGGAAATAIYEQVSTGRTGHREAVLVSYDPNKVKYQRLLEIFWSNVDPLDATGQFCDQGEQYKAAIYVRDSAEKAAAEASKTAEEARLGQPVVTDVLAAVPFYSAEAYHQDYYEKNAARYAMYRAGCGRDRRLEALKTTGNKQPD